MTLKDLLRTVIDNDLEYGIELVLPDGHPVSRVTLNGNKLVVGLSADQDKKILEVVETLHCSPGRAHSLLFKANWNVPYAVVLSDQEKSGG